MFQVLINNGDGTFRDESSLRLPPLPAPSTDQNPDFWFRDLDGDGHLDFLSFFSHTTSDFYRNDGHGVFERLPADFVDVSPPLDFRFIPVDADGDGGVDFIDTGGMGPNAAGETELFLIKALAASVLTVQVNGSSFRTGQTMTLTASLRAGSAPVLTDAYVVLRLPDGSFLSLAGGGVVPGIVPIVTGLTPFGGSGLLLSHTFTGTEPPGSYTWMAALTQAGTLSLIGFINQQTFTFLPVAGNVSSAAPGSAILVQ